MRMETKLNTIDLKSINRVEDVISEELNFYVSVQENFERRYKIDLKTFEEKLEKCELPEHPCWEDSIEWRNAYNDFIVIDINI